MVSVGSVRTGRAKKTKQKQKKKKRKKKKERKKRGKKKRLALLGSTQAFGRCQETLHSFCPPTFHVR
jgi:hypothetical protein